MLLVELHVAYMYEYHMMTVQTLRSYPYMYMYMYMYMYIVVLAY